MATPFMGEIKITAFGFPPKGWALCNGQLLPISQNQSLFSLFSTTYGGDGRTTFALPDLRGRAPMHFGAGVTQGEKAGAESVTLSDSTMPAHPHPATATSSAGTQPLPAGAVLAATNNLYHAAKALTPLRAGTVGNTGGGQAHQNMQPYLTLSFAVALSGIFPSQN